MLHEEDHGSWISAQSEHLGVSAALLSKQQSAAVLIGSVDDFHYLTLLFSQSCTVDTRGDELMI